MHQGHLRKMAVTLQEPVLYRMRLDDLEVDLSSLVGSDIELRFTGKIRCVRCERGIKKTYGDGFCFPCFRDGPESAPCVIKPELCRAHVGEGRDVEWEKENHWQPHVVYLAVSSGLKVGVTRATQVPTRWIDQGAVRALVIARTEHRQQAGLLEVALKAHFADRTDWRKMLRSGDPDPVDLVEARERSQKLLEGGEPQPPWADGEAVTSIVYPVLEYPEKLKSLKLKADEPLTGKLLGIKGQYLMLDGGRVLNVRKHSGYEVSLVSQK